MQLPCPKETLYGKVKSTWWYLHKWQFSAATKMNLEEFLWSLSSRSHSSRLLSWKTAGRSPTHCLRNTQRTWVWGRHWSMPRNWTLENNSFFLIQPRVIGLKIFRNRVWLDCCYDKIIWKDFFFCYLNSCLWSNLSVSLKYYSVWVTVGVHGIN